MSSVAVSASESDSPTVSSRRNLLVSFGWALLGLVLVLLTKDTPGVTLDERINAGQGVLLTESLKHYGVGLVSPSSWREIFQRDYLIPDHPPLGRFLLGVSYQVTGPKVDGELALTPFHLAARVGSAVAFALLIGVIVFVTSRWYGLLAGSVAGASLILMPRVFGHAHLAALETMMNLTYTTAVLSVAAWAKPDPPCGKLLLIGSGVLLGLAFLTKIQAILLPIPLACWMLLRWRTRAVVPLLIWSGVGFLVFFVGWPWLWTTPVEHLQEYFGRTTDRVSLKTFYLGQSFLDREVPWHYPWVMFLVTVPLGLQLLGGLGVVADRKLLLRSTREQLLFLCLVFPLIVFSLPGVAVYDGVRLFLVVFPLWATFIGRGVSVLHGWLQQKFSPKVACLQTGTVLASQALGLLLCAPHFLSYYNLLTFGSRGAEPLGFEATYWGDSLTVSFLEQVAREVPPNQKIGVAPVLYPTQLADLTAAVNGTEAAGEMWTPYDPKLSTDVRYVVIFRRRADISDELQEKLNAGNVLLEERCQGVLVSALYLLPDK